MDQRALVPTQAVLSATIVSAAVLACGHACGFAIVVVVGLGAIGWVLLAVLYRLRLRGVRDEQRRKHDARARTCALLGYGLPLGLAAWAWQTPGFHGWFLHSGAAAFGAALVAVMLTAILASSMIDWYLILPSALGLFGSPIWKTDAEAPDLDKDRRRRVAQIWVFHRGSCELLALSSVALLLAIGLVALGNALSSDRTLPTAFESLGGAGIALGVFGYLGPRLREALDFALAAPVGLGMWVEGLDQYGRDVSGLVVDVSVAPGIKIVSPPRRASEPDHRSFVALGYAPLLSEGKRPPELDDTWYEEAIRRHLARDPSKGEPLWKQALRRLLRAERR